MSLVKRNNIISNDNNNDHHHQCPLQSLKTLEVVAPFWRNYIDTSFVDSLGSLSAWRRFATNTNDDDERQQLLTAQTSTSSSFDALIERDNTLGRGGFSIVYQCKLLIDQTDDEILRRVLLSNNYKTTISTSTSSTRSIIAAAKVVKPSETLSAIREIQYSILLNSTKSKEEVFTKFLGFSEIPLDDWDKEEIKQLLRKNNNNNNNKNKNNSNIADSSTPSIAEVKKIEDIARHHGDQNDDIEKMQRNEDLIITAEQAQSCPKTNTDYVELENEATHKIVLFFEKATRDLTNYIKKIGSPDNVTPSEVYSIALPVASALSILHNELNCVYCDLKHYNILSFPRGQWKLCDFASLKKIVVPLATSSRPLPPVNKTDKNLDCNSSDDASGKRKEKEKGRGGGFRVSFTKNFAPPEALYEIYKQNAISPTFHSLLPTWDVFSFGIVMLRVLRASTATVPLNTELIYRTFEDKQRRANGPQPSATAAVGKQCALFEDDIRRYLSSSSSSSSSLRIFKQIIIDCLSVDPCHRPKDGKELFDRLMKGCREDAWEYYKLYTGKTELEVREEEAKEQNVEQKDFDNKKKNNQNHPTVETMMMMNDQTKITSKTTGDPDKSQHRKEMDNDQGRVGGPPSSIHHFARPPQSMMKQAESQLDDDGNLSFEESERDNNTVKKRDEAPASSDEETF